MYKMGG